MSGGQFNDTDGFFGGTHVARVKLFFSFNHDDVEYPCALVEWFERVADSPEEETGMWLVRHQQIVESPAIEYMGLQKS